MTANPIRLRISAKNVHERLQSDVKVANFFDFAGYKLSDHAHTVDGRAKGLAQYCLSPYQTTRRWITGEASPNATQTFMLYGACLALIYDGDQERMLYEFLHWQDRSLLPNYFEMG